MQLPSRYWSELSTRDFARLAAAPNLGEVVAVHIDTALLKDGVDDTASAQITPAALR